MSDTSGVVAKGYRKVELDLRPIALWGLGEISGSVLSDAISDRHAAITGPVNVAPDLPKHISDGGSINFSGPGLATVVHDAGLLLQAYTLSFWFQIAEYPETGAAILVAKEQSGTIEGDTHVAVTPAGQLRMSVQSATAQFQIISAAGSIALKTTYHVTLRADGSGFEVLLGGKSMGKNVGHTTGWSENRQPLTFGAAPFSQAHAAITLDEVVLYDRTLTDDEICALAQVEAPPVVVPKPPPTTDVPADVRSMVNAYPETSSDEIRIGSGSGDIGPSLRAAIADAPPGRHIVIAPGRYAGGRQAFTQRGTVERPIVIRPESSEPGSVVINEGAWTLGAESGSLIFSKLWLNRSNFNINGAHNRVTRCRFREIDSNGACYLQAATDTRVDHCDFGGPYRVPPAPAPETNFRCCVRAESRNIANGTLKRLLADRNYVHGFPADPNLGEGPFFGSTDSEGWNINAGLIVEYWLVENANPSTGEFFQIKTSGVKVRYCTFSKVRGYLQQRCGGGWELRSCWFEGGAEMKGFDEWAAGMGPALIIGNRMVGVDLNIHAGGAPPGKPGGGDTHTTEPYAYCRSREAQVIGNIADNIVVGAQGGATNAFPAWNCNVYGNTGKLVLQNEQGTKHLDPSTASFSNVPKDVSTRPWYIFEPAVRIPTPTGSPTDQVGMSAPDPYDPEGPQS